MQRKVADSLPTEQTEDCSSEQNLHNFSLHSLQDTIIVDVWADNFQEEILKISFLTKKYNIIAMDTEFPLIEQYKDNLPNCPEFLNQKYLKLTQNVDSTTLVQLGLCLADEDGNLPGEKFCWQFNFKFQVDIQSISPSSAYLLKKAGINFQKLSTQGINYRLFTHQFIKAGLLLNKRNKWIVFHGGYDFSYLLKLIRSECSPKTIEEFYKSLKIYFPQKIDLKSIIQRQKKFKNLGLSKLAFAIQCRRIGPQHQAGSDALLTLQCYFKLKRQFEYLMKPACEVQNLIYGIDSRYILYDKNSHKTSFDDNYTFLSQKPFQQMQYYCIYYECQSTHQQPQPYQSFNQNIFRNGFYHPHYQKNYNNSLSQNRKQENLQK